MNELFDGLLALLGAPRVLAALAFGLVAAFFLAHHLAWFSGGMGALLVLLSFGAGMVWEGYAAETAAKRPQRGQRISKPFSALVLCIVGLAWMFTAGPFIGSFEERMAVLAAAPFAIGGLYAVLFKRPVPIGSMVFATCSLLSGVGVVWWQLTARGLL